MAQTRDVMAYLCEHYPYKSELSKARLTKMIYLSDWRLALKDGRQVTPLSWQFNHYGPYLDDIREIAATDADFGIETTTNMYGSPKELISFHGRVARNALDPAEERAVRHVIRQTKALNYQDFMKLVYSTFPIATQPRYITLDLPSLARQYERSVGEID